MSWQVGGSSDEQHEREKENAEDGGWSVTVCPTQKRRF